MSPQVKNTYKTIMVIKNTYLGFMLDNLGYIFEDAITLLRVRKDILHNLYKDKPEELRLLTTGIHPRYRKKRNEDWELITYNNKEVMVCARKYATIHDNIKLIDRSVDELKAEAKRTYEVLEESGKL